MSTHLKHYVGDGVFVMLDPDTNTVILTTETGRATTNAIVLEPRTLANVLRWLEHVDAQHQKGDDR